MIRNLYRWGLWAALVLLAAGAAWGQTAPAVGAASVLNASSAVQCPTLAVIGSVDDTTTPNSKSIGPSQKDLEDLLVMEVGNQPFLKLVDRQSLEAVMKEHSVALSNLGDANKAAALGKFAGADYLLHVVVAKDMASVRLIETATGQVKLEEEVKLTTDLALFSAAIREKVLAILKPESKIVNYLTVGITEFPNRSGTDRSDKLGIELQKALRSRLKDKAWAVVLERQYPTALLDEVDLARAGLVRGNAVERLPPADLVILGSLEDADREYEAGKPWAVKLDLTVRLRDHSSPIRAECRNDGIEAAADQIMAKIEEFRRQPASQTAVPEKELWRRQALYLMPPRREFWLSQDLTRWQNRVLIPNYDWLSEVGQLELIRAWENVLLLDENDAEALNYLART